VEHPSQRPHPRRHETSEGKVFGPANMSLELTPSVRALECLVTSVGIWSSIVSSWERSSAPSR
jgi:hypothetical protein